MLNYEFAHPSRIDFKTTAHHLANETEKRRHIIKDTIPVSLLEAFDAEISTAVTCSRMNCQQTAILRGSR